MLGKSCPSATRPPMARGSRRNSHGEEDDAQSRLFSDDDGDDDDADRRRSPQLELLKDDNGAEDMTDVDEFVPITLSLKRPPEEANDNDNIIAQDSPSKRLKVTESFVDTATASTTNNSSSENKVWDVEELFQSNDGAARRDTAAWRGSSESPVKNPASSSAIDLDAEDSMNPGAFLNSGAVSDDTEEDYDVLSVEDIEQKDMEAAYILAYLEGEMGINDIPKKLRVTAKRRMRRKIRRDNLAKLSMSSQQDVTVLPSTSSSASHFDLTVESAMAAMTERERIEKEDEEFARKLQEEEERLAGRKASESFSKPRHIPDPAAIKAAEERTARKRQEEEDERLARSLQAQLDRENINQQISQFKKDNNSIEPQSIRTRTPKAAPPTPSILPKKEPATPAVPSSSKFNIAPHMASSSQLSQQYVKEEPAWSSSVSSSSKVKEDPYIKSEYSTMHHFSDYMDEDDILGVVNGAFGSSHAGLIGAGSSQVKHEPVYRDIYNPHNAITNPYVVAVNPYSSQVPRDPDDIPERALTDKEQEQQLKDLLQNVKAAFDIPDPNDRMKSPEELKITLLEHQKIGVAWMLKMERESTNKGGILADDMGLGKTIQAMSTILLNPSEDPKRKTTLIVAPLSLLFQWQQELKSKIKHKLNGQPLRVLVYHSETKGRTSLAEMSTYDVIITTYGAISSSWPQPPKKPKKMANSAEEAQMDEDAMYEKEQEEMRAQMRTLMMQRGDLMKMNWYRVILDEAHSIKNKTTRSARACFQLDAKFRWCLTGTPFQNHIRDLYSLVNFLSIPPFCEWSKFRDQIELPFKKGRQKKSMKMVQAVLKAICLRRTKNSFLDGKPIIMLPEKTTELVKVQMTKDEREFYEALEKRMFLRFNKYLREGTVMQNYSNILVLLLRLRQACCHPSLVSRNFKEATAEDLARAEAEMAANIADGLVNVHGPEMIAGVDDLTPEILEFLKQDKWDDLSAVHECPICFDTVTSGVIVPGCGHVYCRECLVAFANRNVENQDFVEAKTCPTCRGSMSVESLVSIAAFQAKHGKKKVPSPKKKSLKAAEDESAGEGSGDEEEARSRSAKKGKKPIRGDEDGDSNASSDDDPADQPDEMKAFRLGGNWISSSKIDKMVEILDNIRRNKPGEKVIIFSQFVGLLNLCEEPLRQRKFGFVRYDGSMSAKNRDAAISSLQNNPFTNCILISLKCGSLGLNLTCASHVILMDFWWNPATENQAIDRVHRFGQTKEVTVHRVTVENTIEERILELCKTKQNMFNAALGEGGMKLGLKKTGLGVADLMKLFGGGNLPDSDDDE